MNFCSLAIVKKKTKKTSAITNDLPGRRDTMIQQVVFPGQGLPLALWACCPCDFPKRGKLDCIICGSEELCLRSIKKKKNYN